MHQPSTIEFNSFSEAEESELLLTGTKAQEGSYMRIMSWNILAQCLIRREQFPYVQPDANPNPLSIKHRSTRILKALCDLHNPDIATLQEVDVAHWNSRLKDSLAKHGFEFVHVAKNPAKEVGHGLAVLWKSRLFEKVGFREIRFDNHPLISPTSLSPNTGNIGCLVALKRLDSNFGFIVSNHHLFWWWKAEYERLRQIYILLEEVRAFKIEIESANVGVKWYHVMCGDFNTCPNDALYYALTNPENLDDHIIETVAPKILNKPKKVQSAPEPDNANNAEVDVGHLTHHFLLEQVKSHGVFNSAYGHYREYDKQHLDISSTPNGWEGEPSYTTIDAWRGALDYIMTLRHESTLFVNRVLKIPDAKWVQAGLPNIRFPSDHVPIMAEYCVSQVRSKDQ